MPHASVWARRGPQRDANASGKDRNNAKTLACGTFGRFLGLSGYVEALGRCNSIVLLASPGQKARLDLSYGFLSPRFGIRHA